MEVVVLPRIMGVQWSDTVGSTLWGVASGVAIVLDVVHDLAEIAPASCQLQQAVWSSLWSVQSSRCGVPWALQVRVLRAPAVTGHVAIPDPPGQSAGMRTKEVRGSRGGPGLIEGGGPCPRLLVMGIPLRGGAWRHRTPLRAGGGSGAIRVVRWSPDSRSWQNSNGNSAEHVSSRVAGPTVLPQRLGWRADAVCSGRCGGDVGT